jgi:hypothetical protein
MFFKVSSPSVTRTLQKTVCAWLLFLEVSKVTGRLWDFRGVQTE